MRPRTLFLVAVVAMAGVGGRTAAGLYSPDDGPFFEPSESGTVDSLPLATFRLLLSEIAAFNVPTSERHRTVATRIDRRKAQGIGSLTVDDVTGLTHDLIRLGRLDEALNVLQPLTRDRQRAGFFVLTHLARAHQGRSEWSEAYDAQYSALRDYPAPTSLPNYGAGQLAWCRHVEVDYLLPLYHSRREEARRKQSGLPAAPDPLFPPPRAGQRQDERVPVRFIGESGRYEAGSIAAAERSKLPTDAVAVVQQLILWDPSDTRLFWLLGELYNAAGDLPAALQIFDICVDAPRNYSSPTLLEHRSVVSQALAERRERQQEEARQQRAAEEERTRAEQGARRTRYYAVGVVGGLLALLLLLGQVREWRRRWARRSRTG